MHTTETAPSTSSVIVASAPAANRAASVAHRHAAGIAAAIADRSSADGRVQYRVYRAGVDAIHAGFTVPVKGEKSDDDNVRTVMVAATEGAAPSDVSKVLGALRYDVAAGTVPAMGDLPETPRRDSAILKRTLAAVRAGVKLNGKSVTALMRRAALDDWQAHGPARVLAELSDDGYKPSAHNPTNVPEAPVEAEPSDRPDTRGATTETSENGDSDTRATGGTSTGGNYRNTESDGDTDDAPTVTAPTVAEIMRLIDSVSRMIPHVTWAEGPAMRAVEALHDVADTLADWAESQD